MPFRFDNLKALGQHLSVRLPTDDKGFLGRECPVESCLGYFKVKPGTGLSGEALPCHCPYCGHTAPNDQFFTPEQIEYAKSVVMQKVADAIVKDLKTLEFERKPSGGFGIGLSLKVRPGPPLPISHYREKSLETNITCESCALEYAVYGVFAYCPDCGEHNSLGMLSRNLALTRKQISLAESLDDKDLRTHLVEDGLENCVSAFDGFAREACKIRARKSHNPSKVPALSFQNLVIAARQVEVSFGVDWRSHIDPDDFDLAQRAFMRRHLIAHKAGVVDSKYLEETRDPTAAVGRRLFIEAKEVETLASCIERLSRTLLDVLPKP